MLASALNSTGLVIREIRADVDSHLRDIEVVYFATTLDDLWSDQEFQNEIIMEISFGFERLVEQIN